jgi:VacB/RNase II family 3'-5' exoribonuclease
MAPGPRNQLRSIAQRAMKERGLLPSFSSAVTAELIGFTHAATDASATVRDLRTLLWASIDNDDSRDLDQLTVSMPGEKGATKILIAIADVDALVKRGSAVDEHAQTNTTSVYTAAQIFPMLPEKLSTDLTSLNPGKERLAIIVEISIGADGQIGEASVSRGLVLNHAQLAYDSVAAWMEGTGPAPAAMAAIPGLAEQLRIQDRVAHSLKGRRQEHGALNLETIEARAEFEGENITRLRAQSKNRATDLIEEFMVAANGVTARYLQKKGFASLRRILKSPERWQRIVELAATLNTTLPAQPDSKALETFLLARKAADPLRFPDLSLAVVKLLGRGEYALEKADHAAEGHFGLAVKDYTHSTAPNRRFPDVITQRLLKAALADQPTPYPDAELSALALHCTAQEDAATKVERLVRKSAAAMLLGSRLGERFEGIVTGASSKGTWVRIMDPPAEGKVVRDFDRFDVGDRVQVELLRVDVERGFIDFAGLKRS